MHSPVIRYHALQGSIGYGINTKHSWGVTHKEKALDLAIGIPKAFSEKRIGEIREAQGFREVLLSCEAKSVMTEHSKAQSRIYDELSSAHEMVHRGNPNAIAVGIALINIADKFVSPLRQVELGVIHVTNHQQPRAASRMINHLRQLPFNGPTMTGFDAFCSMVIDCDNRSEAHIYAKEPAPQFGDVDHYLTFLGNIAILYERRFNDILKF